MHHDLWGACGLPPAGQPHPTLADLGRVVGVLTISSGHSAGYLLDAVAAGRESYYTGAVAAGEPPGRWYGAGARSLGLSGLVDEQDMRAVYERFLDPRGESFRDPARWGEADTLGHTGRRYLTADELYARALDTEPDASPERRVELRFEASKLARQNVAFHDATFSVQKSVTVLHTAFEAQEVAARKAGDETSASAWAAHREAVEAAIWAGNRAALDYLAQHAGYSRVGHHGGAAGRFIDAHDWTVASFFQHDSRDHDPQLHIHNAILNRVHGTDEQWRTLDGRALYAYRGAAAAVGERTMEEHLTRSLGVRFATRPDGKAREVLGVTAEVMDLFSSRRRAITSKTADLVSAFETTFDRPPNSLELDRLQRQATLATRRAKEHGGETVEERLERWDRQLRAEVAGGLAQVAQDVLALAGQQRQAEPFSVDAVLDTAVADVQGTKARWAEGDLVRTVSGELPDYLGGLDGEQVHTLLHGLAEQAIEQRCVRLTAEAPGADSEPAELRLANGRSAFERPGAPMYATAEHVRSERSLRAATVERGAAAVSPELAAFFVAELAECGIELGADQAAAVRGVLTSEARVESLVGPAGTGKSFVVGALAKGWQDPTLWGGVQRHVFGLAASQIATEVLAGEGLTACNVARWLATQQRLADGRDGGDDRDWQLRDGDLVVVDESAMANTADLTAIRGYIEAAGAKLLLTGDHRQLAAVGAGGGMGLVADRGVSYELAEVRRFTAQWERDASLRLREGDQSALGDYRKHGRIIDGGTVEQTQAAATRAYLADSLAGRHTLLITDTNEQAARISAAVRADLVRLGRVNEAGVPLGLQGTVAGVGDLVQARRNAWDLAGYEGNRRGPINREQYRVLEVRDGGGLIVAHVLGRGASGEHLGDRVTLPGSYVTEHVALGYASTVHAAQGLTVDTCHTVATARTGPAALYVGLSRGRDGNTAYVATVAVPDDSPSGATVEAQRRDPLAVLAGSLDAAEPDRAAIVEAEASAAEMGSVRTPAERLAHVAELAVAGRTTAMLDRLTGEGLLSGGQRRALAADEGMSTLARVLRQAEVAGHDPHQALANAVTEQPLDDARSLASVLHHRVSAAVSLEPVGDSHADWVPAVDDPAWQQHLVDLAQAADCRRDELGAATARQAPQWAVEALGAVPDDPAERRAWVERAGIIAAYRELTGHDDDADALPSPPKRGQVEAYASWRAAWRALGRPEVQRAEAEMSDGQLRVRVRAYAREKAWEPPYVAHDLSGTTQAADRYRQTAEIRAAEAAAAPDATERGRLEREAAEAAALAETLSKQTEVLAEADTVRALWYAHTAETRAGEQRARLELNGRGVDVDAPEDVVTAEQWLAAHAADAVAEDPHRVVTHADLVDVSAAREADVAVFADRVPDGPETALVDIREEAATEAARPAVAEGDWTRVPTADEVADDITRAQCALLEIEQRRVVEERRDVEEARAAQLARWHADDRATATTADERADAAVLE